MLNFDRNDIASLIIQQCGGNRWGSCAQYPISDWKTEVENGDSVQGYWQWVASQAESDGIPVEMLHGDINDLDALERTASVRRWTEEEVRHAKENPSSGYGPECVVHLENGRQLRTPAYPALCSYIRVMDCGYELAFWDCDEFGSDPACVLGALMGAAKGFALPSNIEAGGLAA